LLEDLVRRHPSGDHYRFELLQTYQRLEDERRREEDRRRRGSIVPGAQPELQRDPERDLREAQAMVTQAQQLVQLVPGQREYQRVYAYTRIRLARELMREGQRTKEPQQRLRDLAEAESLIRDTLEQVGRQESERKPNEAGEGDIARALLAMCLLERGEREGAMKEAEAVQERLRQIAASRQPAEGKPPRMPEPGTMMREGTYRAICERLGQMLEKANVGDLARTFKEQVDTLKPPWDRGGADGQKR
jgi:hypothetical protein